MNLGCEGPCAVVVFIHIIGGVLATIGGLTVALIALWRYLGGDALPPVDE